MHACPPLRRWALALIFIYSPFGSFTAMGADLREVLNDALLNDPKLGAAEAGYSASAEQVPQARAGLLPTVTVGATFQDDMRRLLGAPITNENFSSQDTWQASLRQPLVDVTAWFNFRGAQAARDGAQWDLQTAKLDLLIRVADAYFNVLRAQDLLDSTNAQEAVVKRQLEQVQQRFDVGLVAITDVLEAQAAYDNAVVQRIQADGNHDIFFENLRTLTGKAYTQLNKLSDRLPVVYPEPRDEQIWVSEALEKNTTIRSVEQTVLAAERTMKARRSAHLPTVGAVASYSEFRGDSTNLGGVQIQSNDSGSRSLQLQVSVPIFQGGATWSRAREAEFRVDQAGQQLEDRRRTVERDTRNLLNAVITDVVRVRAGLKSIRSSEAALEATQTGYEVGTRNIVDVLLAQQRLYQSQFSYADSRYVYLLDSLRLKQTAGSITPEDLLELNQHLSADQQVQRMAADRLYQDAEETPAATPALPQPAPTP